MTELAWIDFDNWKERRLVERAFWAAFNKSEEDSALFVPEPDTLEPICIGPLPDWLRFKGEVYLKSRFISARLATFKHQPRLFIPHPVTLEDAHYQEVFQYA